MTVPEILPFHPAADIFPLMQGDELNELVTDIRAHGLRQPIVTFEEQIVDGRNRARACERAGVEPHYTPFQGEEKDLVAFIISANIHRRHLTSEQKHELLEKLLRAQPDKSDRQIARIVKRDNKTVASVRRELEAREEIPHVETRTDSKGREQPARKTGIVEKLLKESRRLNAVAAAPVSAPAREAAPTPRHADPVDECVAAVRRSVDAARSDLPPEDMPRLFSALRKLLDAFEQHREPLGEQASQAGSLH